MAAKVYQSGGEDRSWLFDPQDVDTIGPILAKLAVYDEYFINDEGQTTLAIVLDTILDELPPELEEAVRLVYLAGLSYRSASRIVGCDHKTIKARADRGVNALRKRLTDTVWLASLIDGMLPNNTVEPTRVASPDTVFNVLSSLSAIRSSRD